MENLLLRLTSERAIHFGKIRDAVHSLGQHLYGIGFDSASRTRSMPASTADIVLVVIRSSAPAAGDGGAVAVTAADGVGSTGGRMAGR